MRPSRLPIEVGRSRVLCRSPRRGGDSCSRRDARDPPTVTCQTSGIRFRCRRASNRRRDCSVGCVTSESQRRLPRLVRAYQSRRCRGRAVHSGALNARRSKRPPRHLRSRRQPPELAGGSLRRAIRRGRRLGSNTARAERPAAPGFIPFANCPNGRRAVGTGISASRRVGLNATRSITSRQAD